MLEEDLSPREKLYLDRLRRHERGGVAAKRWKVSYQKYRGWEKGTEDDVPKVELRGLDPHEHYVVLRIRHNITAEEMSRMIGVPHRKVWEAEHGDLKSIKRIMEFWGDA